MRTFDKFKYKILRLTPKLSIGYDNQQADPAGTVVFLHGLAADWHSFDGVLQDIAADPGFDKLRLVAVDLLGFGQSPAGDYLDYTMENHLAALRRVLKKLPSPLYLVGHSMGGILAGKYAERYGAAGLVLAAPPLLLPDEQRSIADNLYQQAFTTIEQNAHHPTLQTAGKFIEKSTSFINQYAHSKAFSESMRCVVNSGDGYAAIGRLELPIRIVRGKFDSLTLKANDLSLAKKHPNIRFIEVLAGHDIKGALRAEVVKQLADLLDTNYKMINSVEYNPEKTVDS